MNLKSTVMAGIFMILLSGLTVFGQTTVTSRPNLALGKTATQSSDIGNPFKATEGLASKAVDGNTDGNWNNGSVTHTACRLDTDTNECQGSDYPTWQVDLGAIYKISEIQIWNRTDCCKERLSDFTVQVKGPTTLFNVWEEFSTGPHIYSPGEQNPLIFRGNKQARYIQIQVENQNAFLSLAEVKVFGQGNADRSNLPGSAKANYLITSDSAGDIRFGMTVPEARQAVSGAGFTLETGEEGQATVSQGDKVIMTVSTDEKAKISNIKIWDSRYRTANGVYPGMPLIEAEKLYGKIRTIVMSYAVYESGEFSNQPKGLDFVFEGEKGNGAGIYDECEECDPRERFTTAYSPGAFIYSISVSRYEEEVSSNNESNYLITSDSVGGIRLGMTIGEVRNVLKDAVFIRGEDEGVDIIEVKQSNKTLMYFYAQKGDPNYDAPIDEKTKIIRINVTDSRYLTEAGVHTGMRIEEAEQKYGKLKEIVLYELDESEHATFAHQPNNYDFSVARPGDYKEGVTAGIYERDEYSTTKYVTDTIISGVTVSGNSESESSASQISFLITNNSAGDIRLGMTVAEARKAMIGANLVRSSDGEGVALIGVFRGGQELMTLYAGEVDYDAPVDENARIKNIEVWSPEFMTAEGVHPKMKVSDVEKVYGKVKIIKTELEGREFADFAGQPKYLGFRLFGPGDYGGEYANGETETGRYFASSGILSITIASGVNY